MCDRYFDSFIEEFGEATQHISVPSESIEKWREKLPDQLLKELKEKQQNKEGKVKGVKKTKVPCFNLYDSKRYKKLKMDKERKAFLDEYSTQSKRQQDAINNMSPEDFKIARDAYKKNKRNSLANKAQEDFRNNTKDGIEANIFDSLKKTGSSDKRRKKNGKK
ncbi:Novel toxin 15 [Xenorhabdus japonica]|uniref:Novel toxin 15 n=1 Tax=Xenorhabdus japonica TaxID=53341 RepID=A0A1I5E8V2_9GAMM|nr:Novel toxin 15 [Xenorhabdus japonica]